MNKTSFAERLIKCLDKERFPQKNRGRIQLLAEMVGLTHRGASKWINGETLPRAKMYPILAKKLNVNEHWLQTGEGDMNDLEAISDDGQSDGYYLIEVNIYDMDHFLSEEKKITRTRKCMLPYKGHFFGVELDSEAMSPRFPMGAIMIFDNTEAHDGDFVLVNFNGLPNPIFRQLLIIGQSYYLHAHNPKFERLMLQDKSSIMGKLVQAILSFE